MKADITVVNKHHKAIGEYIGRGSPLGNPWPINPEIGDTRTVVIARYKEWLDQKVAESDPKVCKELNRLAHIALSQHPLRLVCFCKPQACHGDVIRDVLLKALKDL